MVGGSLLAFSLQAGAMPPQAVGLAPGWLCLSYLVLARDLSPQARTYCLFAGVLASVAGMGVSTGFSVPNPQTGSFMVCCLAALLLPRRQAWIVWGITVLLWAACAVPFLLGAVRVAPAPIDVGRVDNWVRVTLVYAAISATLTGSVDLLVRRMEAAIRDNGALRERIAAASQSQVETTHAQSSLEARLQQSQRLGALGTLAEGVGHDFSNLLVVMLDHAQRIAERADDPQSRELAAQIVEAGARGQALNRQLVAFSGARRVEDAEIDVSHSAATIVTLVQRLLPGHIKLEASVEPGMPPLCGPPVAVEQILLNLCVNARDAMPDGGTLSVHVASATGPDGAPAICMRVRDDGEGMDEATQAKVFSPFFTTKAAGKGTGLGLSTVVGLVEQCGGRISLVSAPGAGTTFEVLLPLSDTVEADAPAAAPLPATGTESILVVDDDPGVREIMLLALRDAGYQAQGAQDAERALALVERDGLPAAVVCDAVLPGMGALALRKSLMRSTSALPFIVCSGYGPNRIPDGLLRTGATYVPKPFTRAELLDAVRGTLDRSDAAAAVLERGA